MTDKEARGADCPKCHGVRFVEARACDSRSTHWEPCLACNNRPEDARPFEPRLATPAAAVPQLGIVSATNPSSATSAHPQPTQADDAREGEVERVAMAIYDASTAYIRAADSHTLRADWNANPDKEWNRLQARAAIAALRGGGK